MLCLIKKSAYVIYEWSRSIYGGFVQWHMGAAESGEDSIASVVKEAEHWSDLRILILVVSLQKILPSTV